MLRLLSFNFLLILKEKSFIELNLIFSISKFSNKVLARISSCFLSKSFLLLVMLPFTKNKLFFLLMSINEEINLILLRSVLISVKKIYFFLYQN